MGENLLITTEHHLLQYKTFLPQTELYIDTFSLVLHRNDQMFISH